MVLYLPYNEGEVDFGPLLQELKEGGPAPDALLVVGTGYTLCLVASQLAYFDLQDVQLLGLRVADPEKVLDLCGDYLEGAVFTCPFWRGSPRKEVREFVRSFREAYGEDPDYFAALGWDGVETLLSRGKAGGSPDLLYGVTGLRAFSPGGTPQGDPFKLRVVHGGLQEIP